MIWLARGVVSSCFLKRKVLFLKQLLKPFLFLTIHRCRHVAEQGNMPTAVNISPILIERKRKEGKERKKEEKGKTKKEEEISI